jgi:predicted transcriptional regulator
MQRVTTVRFETDTIDRLDRIAQGLGRSRAWVINDAVARYLEYETWFREEVQKGLDAAEAGDLKSHEQVKERVLAMGVDVD